MRIDKYNIEKRDGAVRWAVTPEEMPLGDFLARYDTLKKTTLFEVHSWRTSGVDKEIRGVSDLPQLKVRLSDLHEHQKRLEIDVINDAIRRYSKGE